MEFKEIYRTIENGIRKVYDSDRYQDYLKTMARFHNYSTNNCLLIFSQCPDATLVAGYQKWRMQFHRYVRKGEKGIRILAPMRNVVEEGEEVFTGEPMFKYISVFDISQTEGEPLPTYIDATLEGKVKDYDQFLQQLELISPVPVKFSSNTGNASGYYRSGEEVIYLKQGMSELHTIKTLLHEMAHALLHNRELGGMQMSRSQKEVEAESVAYIICQHFGLDTSEYSFPYLAGYSSSSELPELRESINRIHTASKTLIRQLESLRNPDTILRSPPDIREQIVDEILGAERHRKEISFEQIKNIGGLTYGSET